MTLLAFALLLIATVAAYALNRLAAGQIRARGGEMHSLVGFHGAYAALLVMLPGLVLILVWMIFQGPVIDALLMGGLPGFAVEGRDPGAARLLVTQIKSIAAGQVFGTPDDWMLAAAERLNALRGLSATLMVVAVVALSVLAMVLARLRVSASFRARHGVERIVLGILVFCSTVAVFTTAGIVLSLIYESYAFFRLVPLGEFLFGTNWEPQIPIRADQIAGAGAFGWLPVILGTLVITAIALAVSVPVGLFTAIYLNEFATPRARRLIKPVLEILAGVPTVVYGFFAVLTVAPAIRSLGGEIGIAVSPNTALAAGGVMAIMLIPFISSFADDALSAVPRALRDGSLALGATQGETVMKVLFPAAIPGIVGGVLLAISRAIGETMIVVMAAGLIARMTINPLDSVTTVTVQIVTLLIGDTAFDNPKTLAAFALGMMLFIVTLGINILALRIVRKYRELYD